MLTDVTIGAWLFGFLFDAIHHRGQLSTYLRPMGGTAIDEALKRKWKFAPPKAATGKRVLVVGAGPAGLATACATSPS